MPSMTNCERLTIEGCDVAIFYRENNIHAWPFDLVEQVRAMKGIEIYTLSWLVDQSDGIVLSSFSSADKANEFAKELVPKLIDSLNQEHGESQTKDSFRFEVVKSNFYP